MPSAFPSGRSDSPDYLREVYSSQTERIQHAQGYENPRFDELAEQQLRTLDEDERMELGCARPRHRGAAPKTSIPGQQVCSITICG